MIDDCARYESCRYDPGCELYGGCRQYAEEPVDTSEPVEAFQTRDVTVYEGWIQPCPACQRMEIHTHIIHGRKSRSLVDVALPETDVSG